MQNGRNQRDVKQCAQQLVGTPEQVFPLLCPVREYEWIDGWKCNVVYTKSGVAELDCVFQTAYPREGGEETWVVHEYEPNRKIAFVRFNPLRTIRFTIELEPVSEGTKAVWTQVITGLNDEGNRWVLANRDERFGEMVARCERQINHFLTTGHMLVDGVKAGA